MINDNFTHWDCIEDLQDEYFFTSLIDDDNGFILEINPINTTRVLRLEFGYQVIYYEKIPELASLKFIDEKGIGGKNEQLLIWENSTYVAKIYEDSYGFYDKSQIKHLLFIHPDGLIHILTLELPQIIWAE